jgi:hypothetical protein
MHQRRQRLPSSRVLQQRKVRIVASDDDVDHYDDSDDDYDSHGYDE